MQPYCDLKSLLRSKQRRELTPTAEMDGGVEPSFQLHHRGTSTKSSVSGEIGVSRVYFKGLVSEEIVNGEKKVISGIGIAIRDEIDASVYEQSKGLIEIEKEVSSEVAEVKALIEGLDAALNLGLERINVVSDNETVFKYITGELHPGQQCVSTLIEQASLLPMRFSDCQASVVSRKDVEFVAKLARDSIVAQRKDVIETCSICLEDSYFDQMFSVNGCLHRYCFSCMKKHAEDKLLQGMLLPKCPHEGCNSELTIKSCKKFLTPVLYDLMSERLKEATIPVAEKIYCPYPRCSALMSKSDAQGCAGSSSAGDRKCTKCYGLFCINCRVPWHSNMSCSEYKKLNPYSCVEDAMLKNLAAQNLWRQCPVCHHMVSLAYGCYHIICRCGYEFCYTCGAEWKNKTATCRCPYWDEHNIIYNEA